MGFNEHQRNQNLVFALALTLRKRWILPNILRHSQISSTITEDSKDFRRKQMAPSSRGGVRPRSQPAVFEERPHPLGSFHNRVAMGRHAVEDRFVLDLLWIM